MEKLIYIAEDDKSIRELERAFLAKSGYTVEVFENGDSLYARFNENPADLVILDIMMPGTDGLTLCSNLREESNVPIIIVSAKGSDIERVTGITIGCDDYMAKPFSPIELVARVQAIFRRMEMNAPKVSANTNLTCGDIVIDKARRQVTVNGDDIEFTPNEFGLLVYLIENIKRAVSRDELLQKVWDFGHEEIDSRATDDTVKRLRKKLRENGSRVQIETVRGFGFRLNAE